MYSNKKIISKFALKDNNQEDFYQANKVDPRGFLTP